MAIVHKGASLVPSKTELIASWMPQQRWYHGKGHDPVLRDVLPPAPDGTNADWSQYCEAFAPLPA